MSLTLTTQFGLQTQNIQNIINVQPLCSYLQIIGIEWNKKRKTANAAIASFEAPKIPSVAVKITLKFVLLITDDSESTGDESNKNNSSDKDCVIVTVQQEPKKR